MSVPGFPPDIFERARRCLIESGVHNHEHALFLSLVAQEVVGHPNPVFCQQQPKKPKSALNQAWKKSYMTALEFLRERGLTLTLATMQNERPEPFAPGFAADRIQLQPVAGGALVGVDDSDSDLPPQPDEVELSEEDTSETDIVIE